MLHMCCFTEWYPYPQFADKLVINLEIDLTNFGLHFYTFLNSVCEHVLF